MKSVTGVLFALLTLSFAPILTAQTGWSVDRYEGFRANITGGTNVTTTWTTGNLGNAWDEGEWVPYCLTINVSNLGATGFTPIRIAYDFTKGNPAARFVDLVRGVQVGFTGCSYFPLTTNNGWGWPGPGGTPCPISTVVDLNDAQKCPDANVWGSGTSTAWKLLSLPESQMNRDLTTTPLAYGSIGTVTEAERCFTITQSDLTSAGVPSNYSGTLQIYLVLHLSQTFIWTLSLQSQMDTPPTDAWGGYLYSLTGFSTDSRQGSGYVPGSSGHTTVLGVGSRTVSIPIPPAPVGEISGLKFYDANANGVRDGSEPVLEGWPIYITTIVGGNPVSYTRITDSQGAYSLTGLPGAVYTVSEKHQGPKPTASPPPNYPYAAFAQSPPSTWDESYPPIPTSINGGAATAVPTSAAGIALGYAPESWAVDLVTTNVQGNINFGNFVPPPQCEVTPSAVTACAGDQVTFTAARIADGTPPYTVAWTGPNNFTASTFAITVTAGPLTAGTYTAVLTDANGLSIATGCSATLSLYPQPACAITGGPLAVCASSTGHTYFAPVNNTPPVNIVGYSWQVTGNGTIVGPTTGQQVTVDATGDGSYTVILTTESTDGCFSTCSTTVTVNPLPSCIITNTDPVCPGATTVHAGPANMSSYAWTISAGSGTINGSTTSPTVSVTAGNANNSSYTLMLTVTDANNCSAMCQATVQVKDDTPPTMGCASDQSINCPAPTTLPFTPPTVTDNCDPNPVVIIVGDVTTAGSCPQNYSVTRTWRATDFWGNTAECSQIIYVVDNIPPSITGVGADLTIDCPATPVFSTPQVSDLCDPQPILTHTDNVSPGNCPGNYMVTRTWTARDACNNSSAAMQTIRVRDITPPVITLPPTDLTQQCYDAGGVASWAANASATDLCDGSVAVVPTWNPPVDNCNRTVTVTFTATDLCGNSSTATKTFLVNDNTPPTITCPQAVIVQCASQVSNPDITIVTATDNCGTVTVTHVGDVISNQTCLNRFTVTRTYMATDVCGNSATCAQIITVNDDTPPTITCPQAVTVQCASQVPNPDITSVTAADNCAGTVTVTHVGDVISNQTCLNRFTVTRTYKATDVCGNSATCAQIITVNDDTPPTITCPQAVTVQCASQVPNPDITSVTATDNCAGTVTVTHVGDVISNQTCLNRYTITRTYKATDVCGNSATCDQIITVNDDTPPTITCPQAVTVQCASQVPNPDITSVTATDNCAGTVTVTHVGDVISNQTCLNRYTITRTYKATDVCGNSATCDQIITVNDDTPPTITCPQAVTVQCASQVPNPDINSVTATDNCAGTVTVTHVGDVISNQNCLNRYTITRTYKATDVCGNSATCDQIITVYDDTPPTITCPQAVTVQCASQVPNPDINSVTATDNCGPVTVTHVGDVISNQSCLNRYTITRTYKATDVCGNSAMCDQIITVYDNTPPSITCPQAVTVQCASQVPNPDINSVTATDNCGPVTVTHVGDVISNQTCLNRFTVTRTYMATDVCGNSATCAQIITVNDDTPPTITCPQAVTVQCASQVPNPDINSVLATDNCAGTVTVTHVSDVISNQTCLNRYTITRTYMATDVCGNSATCDQIITVNDDTPPTITCPQAVTVQCVSQVPNPDITSVTATDNCAGTVTVTHVGDVISNQTCLNRYTITRTYKATDVCGNSATCDQIITVNDDTPPTITCPQAVTVQCASQVPNPDINSVTATDNCAGTVTVTHVGDVISNQTCLNRYTITRTYKATDVCGNSATCDQIITVNDDTPPTITCPQAVTVQCASQVPNPDITSVTATDNCAGTVTVTHVGDVISNQTCLNRYTITRTYKATDVCGNSATCDQIITVNDDTPPTITCPQAVTVQCASQVPNPDINSVTATDNCAGTVTVTHVGDVISNQTCLNRFTVTRTYMATDVCGNSATCDQIITVYDDTPPTITCPQAVTVQCASQVPNPDITSVTATDNCAGTVTVTHVGDVISNQTCLNRYTITRTYKATDVCGNSATCDQIITVNDDTPPTITCPQAVTVQCASQVPNPDINSVTATDNCAGTVTVTHVGDVISNQTCLNRFTVTRTYMATDVCGNSATCDQIITVYDDTPPTITVPTADLTLQCYDATAVATWIATASALDNCDGSVAVTSDYTPPTSNCNQTVTVTFMATDVCGNSSTATKTFLVDDTEGPQWINLPPVDIVVDCADPIVFWDPQLNIDYADNCDPLPILHIKTDHMILPQPDGTKWHYRSWWVVDACQNWSDSVSQTIVELRCQFATLTQGAYGNANGTWCATGQTRIPLLNTVLLTTPLTVGLPGHSFTVGIGKGACLVQYMPSGGPAAVLQSNDYYFGNNCNIIPGNFSQIANGKFRNILLGQTITFALNLRLDPNLLTGVKLPPTTLPYMYTIQADYVNGICLDGDDVEMPLATPQAFYIPPSVITALQALYPLATDLYLPDLLALANMALAGQSTYGASLADITMALDAYNRGFDEARFFAGYWPTLPPKSNHAEVMPSDFQLYQNHPNPFNPSTMIEYEVPVPSEVHLAIYNSLGKLVAVLVDGQVREGRHSVMWNSSTYGKDLPSGVYMYRMTATGTDGRKFASVKTMMLVK
jgi:ribosomal protein S26